MDTSFASSITADLSNAFFYCPKDGVSSIQIGKPMAGDFIFWLKYNDEDVNKCASRLIKELGHELGINNIQSAKEILLKFCSYAFNIISANFLSLTSLDKPVSTIFSQQHRNNLSTLFVDYIEPQKALKPYVYTIRYAYTDGVHRLTNNLCIYGSGQIESLLGDMRMRTGINFPLEALDDKDLLREPIGIYKLLTDSSAILVYARSINEAAEELDRLFGALCTTIDAPLRINQDTVDCRINSFDSTRITTSQIRSNLPSVYEINLSDEVAGNLQKIFSSPTKRMKSALSFIAHGWTHDRRERFLNQFIALDALYGMERSNKASIVGGVSRDASDIVRIESKIKTIYELRSKFVHGGISIFSDHGKYPKFVDEHGIDPIEALFEIVRVCTLNYRGVYKVEQPDTVNLRVPKGLVREFEKKISEYCRT
ncbi:hypothetical protein L2737_08470 [Shewanella electrodiphila]|uniref:Apea-like HEPN domain-containing protein n=1 Tax=Shewanella electrodiphila TaxID=934143 RepID=A0ABT0KNE6_9GAMM|nr:HEPN domain-containing protein [Shewanella electrodiphila]MCL1045358.1 hypothetical protein [Shewanella electrodiphila]